MINRHREVEAFTVDEVSLGLFANQKAAAAAVVAFNRAARREKSHDHR